MVLPISPAIINTSIFSSWDDEISSGTQITLDRDLTYDNFYSSFTRGVTEKATKSRQLLLSQPNRAAIFLQGSLTRYSYQLFSLLLLLSPLLLPLPYMLLYLLLTGRTNGRRAKRLALTRGLLSSASSISNVMLSPSAPTAAQSSALWLDCSFWSGEVEGMMVGGSGGGVGRLGVVVVGSAVVVVG